MAQYVKFMRGSPMAFDKLSKKDVDTLYFIYENEIDEGKLYLGDRLIAGGDIGRTSIDALKDVMITEELVDKSLLVYDLKQKLWINKSFNEVISTFIPPTSQSNGVAGLVPAPPKGQNDLFLRSDGQWVDAYFESSDLDINENIFIYDENGELNLYGFFGAETGAQLTKGADGKLCWVVSDLSILNDLKIAVETLQQEVNKLTSVLPIEKVDGTLMFDTSTKTLSVNKITSTHITDLSALLAKKADLDAIAELRLDINTLSERLIWSKLN